MIARGGGSNSEIAVEISLQKDPTRGPRVVRRRWSYVLRESENASRLRCLFRVCSWMDVTITVRVCGSAVCTERHAENRKWSFAFRKIQK